MAPADDASVAATAANALKSRPRVCDADAHADAPYEMWADYLPPHLKEFAPKVEHGEEHDWIVFEGKKRPVMLISNTAGKEGKDYKMMGRRSEQRPVWLPETRLGDMDADGMESAVLFSNGLLATQNPELFIASFESYNRWLWDWCGADRKRLIPVAYVPTRDPDETIRFLHDVAKMGMRSVNIPAYPMSKEAVTSSVKVGAVSASQAAVLSGDPSSGRSYADPEWDRFWATVQDLDLTITMHLGARLTRFGEKRHFLPDLVMTKVAMAEPAAIAIYNGIFQKYPKLRLVLVESGVGWMSWMAEYMDRTWEKQRFWTESCLTEPPSFYMDQNVYASFIHDKIGIALRNEPGGRNIMWSSDYPHSETTFPHSHDVITRDFAGVPEAEKREILCDRARRVYRVD
jgi:predicted TIM-barrel fold metal-dependent hydrolase